MIKILHSADWHLDSPLLGHGETLRRKLLSVPEQIARLCREDACDMVLLAGDLFDGGYTPHTYQLVYAALESMEVPVFVTPGNHDFCDGSSPWIKELWPENVHIFKRNQIEAVTVPSLDCRVYGAGFTGMDAPALLANFRADGDARYQIGVFHGDPVTAGSAYNPVTALQAEQSGLQYLALGHVHGQGRFTAGQTLCAWPGCPMGRGYDEQGEKGVYIVTVADTVSVKFRVLDGPRFYDLQAEPAALESLLPPVGSDDYYRITLTGCCDTPDLDALQAQFARFPNLRLRDKTTRPVDVWGSLGQDSFEGVYFGLLRQAFEQADPGEKEDILLAARLSRQLLEGQEVVLP